MTNASRAVCFKLKVDPYFHLVLRIRYSIEFKHERLLRVVLI